MMKLEQLKISGIYEPVGYEMTHPVLSWKVAETKGQRPVYTSIDVTRHGDDNQILFHTEGADLKWEGTRLDLALSPRTKYDVKIRVQDDCGEEADGDTFFETGKMQEPWTGQWIGTKNNEIHPVFRQQFSLTDIKSGRLYLVGLGLYEAYLNGEKVGTEYLTPYFNDYSEFVQVQTYDVSMLLKEENTLDIYLGKGWYSARFGMASQCSFQDYRLIAELHVQHEHEEETVIGTDTSWMYVPSPVVSSGIYDGEVLDDRINLADGVWQTAVSVDAPDGKLIDRYSLPVVKKQELQVKEVIPGQNGTMILDFGQNMTGWVTFTSCLEKDEQVHFEFGEILQNGEFYNKNYKTATGGFTYISDGTRKLVRPHFTYYGFRYVQISGSVEKIDPAEVTAWVLYSDLDDTGMVETDHEKLNRLFQNCVWGQKSNFLDIPSDCPQRDERLGWTGDAQIFAPAACYNMDARAFYRKFMWMMRTAQKHCNGGVPAYVPESFILCDPAAGWGDAATILPSVLWKYYQNQELLQESYPMMKDWVDYVGTQVEKSCGKRYGLWTEGFQFGDWLALDGFSEQEYKGSTPDEYMASMYYYNSLNLLCQTARILGKEEADAYQELADSQKNCLLDEYFSPKGHLTVNTQTGYILAVQFEVYRDYEVLVSDFVKQLRRDKFKIKGGFAGGPVLCQTLAKCGRGDLAYHFLLNEDYPGWLYEVNQGATTIWERWNSVLPDGTINPMGMNSLNHYAYGSVCEFFYKYMAGIQAGEDGFRSARIEPVVSPLIRHVKAVYDSVSGKYEVEYHLLDSGEIDIRVEVPFGCSACLKLPETEQTVTLSAGTYRHTYQPDHDVRCMYAAEAFLTDVFKNTEAEALIMEEIRQAVIFRNPDHAFRQVSDLFELIPMGADPQKVGMVVGQLSQIKVY